MADTSSCVNRPRCPIDIHTNSCQYTKVTNSLTTASYQPIPQSRLNLAYLWKDAVPSAFCGSASDLTAVAATIMETSRTVAQRFDSSVMVTLSVRDT